MTMLLPLLSDGLLLLATLGLAVYCRRLSTRLRAFDAAEDGVGAAVATLSARVDDMRVAAAEMPAAPSEMPEAAIRLDEARERAEDTLGRLEMLIAAAEDVATVEPAPPAMAFSSLRNERAIGEHAG